MAMKDLIEDAGPDKIDASNAQNTFRQSRGNASRALEGRPNRGVENHGQLILVVRRNEIAAHHTV